MRKISTLVLSLLFSAALIGAIPFLHLIYRNADAKTRADALAMREVDLFQRKKRAKKKQKILKKIQLKRQTRRTRSSRSRFQIDLSVSGPSDGAAVEKSELKVEAYEMGQTDTPPFLKRQRRPSMPLRALEEEVPGTVIVRFLVDEQGGVSMPRIIRETPSGYGFGSKAMEAVREYRFEPAKMRGIPVKIWVTQEIEFTLED